MKQFLFCLCLLLGVVFGLINPERSARAEQYPAGSIQDIEVARRTMARTIEAGTVFIVGEKADSYSLGSGFIVGKGRVITNAHVVEDCDSYIILNALLKPVEARLLALDKSGNSGMNDFALLAFDPPAGVDLPILRFNAIIERMDKVSAWGYPAMVSQFDDHFTALFEQGEFTGAPPVVYTEGTVSTIVTRGKTRVILHTAALASGNSGGPLVNYRGEVVGINTWGYTEEEEGSFVNASLIAEDAVAFLKKNKVNPLMASSVPAYAPTLAPALYSPTITAESVPGKKRKPSAPSEPSIVSEPSAPSEPSVYSKTPKPSKPSTSAKPSTFSEPSEIPETSAFSGISDFLNFSENLSQASSAAVDEAEQRERAKRNADQGESDVWNEEEIEAVIELADAGDPNAQVALGWFYYSGEQALVPQDLDKALAYMSMAAKGNDPVAQELLGIMYLLEKELHNPKKALEYLRKAANAPQADPEHQAFLARVLYYGETYGVPRNAKEAFMWASKAAQANDADGKAFLALLYYYGEEVELDEEKGLKLALESIQEGSSLGQAVLGWMYYDGRVVEESDAQALDLAQKAIAEEEPLGQALLAALYYYECIAPPKKQSPAQAAEPWARLSADQGNEFGRTILGTMYYKGDAVERNYSLAWAYLSLATSQGMTDAAATLAELEPKMNAAELSTGRKTLRQWQRDWGM